MVRKRWAPLAVTAVLVSCGPDSGTVGSSVPTSIGVSVPTISSKTAIVQLGMTDQFTRLAMTKPMVGASSVVVNVKHVELKVAGGGKQARVIVAGDLGPVDLTTLKDGLVLPMDELEVPGGLSVTQIRLVLEETGNYLVQGDQSVCSLQTPSQQQSGLKLLLSDPVVFEADNAYSIVVEFDSERSVVLKGNGGCLLKPVLKVHSALRVSMPDDGGTEGDGASPGDDSDAGGGDPTPSTPTPTPAPEPDPDGGSSTTPTPTPLPEDVEDSPEVPVDDLYTYFTAP